MRRLAMLLVGTASLLTGPLVATPRPVPVSPATPGGVAHLSTTCPTYSWSVLAAATAYRLLVYEVTREGAIDRTVVERDLPAGATTWTASLGQCLSAGATYAWVVGAAVTGSPGFVWSEPAVFRVVPLSAEAQILEPTGPVRSSPESEPGRQLERVPEAERRELAEAAARARVEASAPAVTKLTVDGNIAATTYTGDGTNLDGMATDLELSNHAGAPDTHFSHAGSLASLNTQISATLADGPHTLDTTCLAAGVACNFAGSTSEGGPALSGDSATAFFSTGQIEEPRIGDELARDTEVELAILEQLCAHGVRRYLDRLDGTVLDCATGLLWLKDASCADLAGTDAEGQADWDGAEAAVAALSSGTCGLTDGSVAGDWRQPTVAEFCSVAGPGSELFPCPSNAAANSLIDSSVGPPRLVNGVGNAVWTNGDAFVGVQEAGYQTGTEVTGTVCMYAHLGGGQVSVSLKTNVFFVWPVRPDS